MKSTPRPDPTRNERQARIRETRKKWLNEHGFVSMEGMTGKLMEGKYILVEVEILKQIILHRDFADGYLKEAIAKLPEYKKFSKIK